MTLLGSFQIKKPDVIPVHCKSKGNMTRKNRMFLEQFNQTGTVPFLDAMCLSKGTHTVCKE